MVERIVGTVAYRLAQVIVWCLARFLWRMQIEGTENVPKTGPFILAPNHRSNVDGPLTVILTSRRMKYLAKSEMFSVEILGRLWKSMGAIAVNRGAPDRASLQACMKAMAEGRGLVLFPEGTRQSGDQIADVHEGAAYLALRGHTPIIPVGFGHTKDAHKKGKPYLSRAKLTCIVGDPLVFERTDPKHVTREEIDEATALIQTKLQELFDRSEQRRSTS